MFFLLRELRRQLASASAAFLAVLVLSPVLFLGAAILYVDQVARVGTTRDERAAARRAALGGRGA